MNSQHTPDGDTQVALFQLRSRARAAEIERRSRANQTLDETEAIHREIMENYRRVGEQSAGCAQPAAALSPAAPAERAPVQTRVGHMKPDAPPQVSVVSWAWFVFSPLILLPPLLVVGAFVVLMGAGAIWGAVQGDVNSGVALAGVAAFSVAGLLGLAGTVLSIAITTTRAKVSRTELYWRRTKKRALAKSR